MDLPTAILDKIRSDDLRDAAVAEAPRPRTVIVELDLPMPKLVAAAPLAPGLRSKPRFRFAAPDPVQDPAAEAGRTIEASKEDIASITGRPPETYLSAAASFVVTATGEQIGRIARMASVSAIWPNAQRGR